MTSNVRTAICLHPLATDLTFLNPVRKRIGKVIGEGFRGFAFGNPSSTAEARQALEERSEEFVVIFAHGGSDYIRGGEYVHRVSREIVEGNKFLTLEDAEVFRDRGVFCLSCESNGLAESAIRAGATAFVGFDDVPFNRYDAAGELITNHEFERHAQRLLATAVSTTLERFFSGKLTLKAAVAFFRLFVCQDAARFVRNTAAFKQRREVAALLLRVKDGIRYWGEDDIAFRQ